MLLSPDLKSLLIPLMVYAMFLSSVCLQNLLFAFCSQQFECDMTKDFFLFLFFDVWSVVGHCFLEILWYSFFLYFLCFISSSGISITHVLEHLKWVFGHSGIFFLFLLRLIFFWCCCSGSFYWSIFKFTFSLLWLCWTLQMSP